ncbi:MAG: hypothetical protein HRU20_13555 [Pseudomonadales bacterium]|nr:hypothetical protein [Pseudomonadales bacterium]
MQPLNSTSCQDALRLELTLSGSSKGPLDLIDDVIPSTFQLPEAQGPPSEMFL